MNTATAADGTAAVEDLFHSQTYLLRNHNLQSEFLLLGLEFRTTAADG